MSVVQPGALHPASRLRAARRRSRRYLVRRRHFLIGSFGILSSRCCSTALPPCQTCTPSRWALSMHAHVCTYASCKNVKIDRHCVSIAPIMLQAALQSQSPPAAGSATTASIVTSRKAACRTAPRQRGRDPPLAAQPNGPPPARPPRAAAALPVLHARRWRPLPPRSTAVATRAPLRALRRCRWQPAPAAVLLQKRMMAA